MYMNLSRNILARLRILVANFRTYLIRLDLSATLPEPISSYSKLFSITAHNIKHSTGGYDVRNVYLINQHLADHREAVF